MAETDNMDRRGFLSCMAWVGTGMLWTVHGGVLSSRALAETTPAPAAPGDLHFVQISDSHIGFKGAANTDVAGTLQETLRKINALPDAPAFVVHTGDITQNGTEAEFGSASDLLVSPRTRDIFYVPGEHDVASDNGALYRKRYGKKTAGDGWYSFDVKGVHFIGLSNVTRADSGLGMLGKEQLEWLKRDVQPLRDSTPVVVMAHIPLWNVYPEWGWGTEDSAQALTYLKRFGSVTVLNGHIHQTMQKVEGNITFHTGASTAFPQAEPAPTNKPGPMKVEPGRLRELLGVTEVAYVKGTSHLAVTSATLAK